MSSMPNLLPTSYFKTTAAVVTTGVISVAAAVIFTVPSVSHFVMSCFPIIYDKTAFLLQPPYLYLVINCIIVSIVATSKLTQKSYSIDDSDFSEVVTPVTVVPVPSDLDTSYLNVVHVGSDYTGFVENTAPVEPTAEDVQKFPEIIAVDGEVQQTETEKPKPRSDSPSEQKKLIKPKNYSAETEKLKPKNDSPETEKLKHTKKPPRNSKNSTEGGGNKKSAVLGVSKPPRKQDTLETTWKKITEGRSTPLTKHLTKSDTWQERTHVQSSSSSKEKMTKSDNLNDINTPTEETRLKRDPSPGQEELNRRVEAFIKKFNEEMRLQRLESLAKYNEMVNAGTPL